MSLPYSKFIFLRQERTEVANVLPEDDKSCMTNGGYAVSVLSPLNIAVRVASPPQPVDNSRLFSGQFLNKKTRIDSFRQEQSKLRGGIGIRASHTRESTYLSEKVAD